MPNEFFTVSDEFLFSDSIITFSLAKSKQFFKQNRTHLVFHNTLISYNSTHCRSQLNTRLCLIELSCPVPRKGKNKFSDSIIFNWIGVDIQKTGEICYSVKSEGDSKLGNRYDRVCRGVSAAVLEVSIVHFRK